MELNVHRISKSLKKELHAGNSNQGLDVQGVHWPSVQSVRVFAVPVYVIPSEHGEDGIERGQFTSSWATALSKGPLPCQAKCIFASSACSRCILMG